MQCIYGLGGCRPWSQFQSDLHILRNKFGHPLPDHCSSDVILTDSKHHVNLGKLCMLHEYLGYLPI